MGLCLIQPQPQPVKSIVMDTLRRRHTRAVPFVIGNRSRREHDDDAYLVPSDWEDDDINDDWDSGTGAAGKRARDRERALIQVNDANIHK